MDHYFELNLRNDSLSGRLSTDIRQKGSMPADSRPIILLIHGFNNNYTQAKKSFDAFIENFKRSASTSSMPKSICSFYWPGNRANALASIASYPIQIPKATRCASMLSNHLIDLAIAKPYTKFIVVAHSLGSRLILEAILHAEKRFPQMADRFHLTVLMAAAVPVIMVNDRSGHLYRVRLSGKQFYGLHSTKDTVLQWAFRAGQTAAGEGILPEAMGLKGNPKSFWTAGEEATGLKHDQYWQSEDNSSLISKRIGQPSSRLLANRKISRRNQTYYWLNEFGEK